MLSIRLALVVALGMLAVQPASAANFIVNQAGSEPDDDADAPGSDDAVCDIDVAAAGLQCTLRAAIQEANDQAATAGSPHNITFNGPTAITLTVGLDTLAAPTNINGAVTNGATGGRLELNGNNLGCFQLAETDTAANDTGARGSTIRNFVIRNCGAFGGIGLSGHGYTITGNRIGTNGAGTASDLDNDANSGYGISVSGTIPPITIPDIGSFVDDPPANFGAIVAFASGLAGALTAAASPTIISGNLISGNTGNGIELTNPMTVNVQINTNIIGLNQSSTLALPNGRGGGDAAGIMVGNGVWGSVIGPANIISGQTEPTDNGIVVATGEVLLPNFIMGNLIGPGATQVIDVGNAESGIIVDTRPDKTGPSQNPTDFALFIGPANTISDNRGTNSTNLDIVTGDAAGGIVTGATTSGVRIFGNQIGAFAFPAGGTPIGSLDVGNAGDGIIVNSAGVQIGGSEAFEANLILRNGKHGIVLKGSATNGNIVRNNFVGVMPDGLDVFDFANIGDGIHVDAAGSLVIGGPGEFDDNVVAGNGRHGIVLRNGNMTQGWANHLQRNQVYRNAGLGIDLDVGVPVDAPLGTRDPTDDTPDQDPNDTFYANYGQNAPVITGINGALQYTLQSASSRQYRIDQYQDTSPGVTAANAQGRTWISETTIVTDATGAFTGSVAAPSGGGFVTLTATDISPAADVPGVATNGPHNNTSEFSNALQVIEYSVGDTSVAEGASATTATLTFVVTRSSGAGAGSVDVATADNTATTADGDYVARATTTVPFADGETSVNVAVTVNGDATFEPNETLFLNLSNPMNGVIADGQGIGTITNDDAQPTISIADVTLAEGTGGASTPFTFAVTLSNPSSQTITVSAQSASGGGTPATAGTDYTALGATTLTFVPGDTSESAVVQVTHDADVEPAETFLVDLSAPTNATLADPQALGTINNDDGLATPDVTISDVALAEGSGGGTSTFSFTVTLSGASASSVTIDYATADGTATVADADYTAETGQVVIAPGMTTGEITIDVARDPRFEADETFFVNLTGATGGAITDNQALGTIQNDDGMPTFSVGDPSVVEGSAGTTTLGFVVTLSTASGLPASVSAASADGTATVADADYAALAATPVDFAPGTTQQTVLVTVNGDTKFEPDETVLLNLSGATGATIADPQGTGTITNDDGQPVIAVVDGNIAEGNAGSVDLPIAVTLSNASSTSVTVDFATADDSATAGSDYTTTSGTITFAPGDIAEAVLVPVLGDTTDEPNETLFVSFTNPQGATLPDMQAIGTILNDDAAVAQFSISDASLAEGNAGTTAFVFTVSRSATAGAASVTVQSADGAATVADGDYAAFGPTVVNFADGDGSEDVTVLVTGDVKLENDEDFTMTLSAPSTGAILDGSATGTILNDDAFPNAVAQPVSMAEGNAGNTAFTFTVTLTSPSALPLTSTVQTMDGTATVANNDYIALAPGATVTFAPGDMSEDVTVDVVGDLAVEADETFTLIIGAPGMVQQPRAPTRKLALGGSSATGTILDDDGLAQAFAIGDVTLAEGNAGTTAFVFTITRTGDTTGTASVTAQSAAGGATAATGGGVDFVDLGATVVDFAAGATTATATVQVVGEATVEPDETFLVNLTNPSTGTIIDPQGLGTITNDDAVAASSFAIGDVTLAEGNAGTTAFVFTITRSGDTGGAGTVTAQSAVGGAQPATGGGVDFVDLGATVVNFAAGATTATVTVQVVGETAVEPNETFLVNLTNPSTGTIGDPQGVGTITNDDAVAGSSFAIGDVSLAEGHAGTTAFVFTITRSGDTSAAATLTAQSATGGAQPAAGGGADFVDLAATLVSFAPGATTATVTVQVVGDGTFEPNETFLVNLSGASSGTITDAQGLGTIVNDDPTPSVSIADLSLAEGNAGTTAFPLVVTLSNPSSATVTVTLTAVPGSATSPGDYAALGPVTVTFAPGQTTQTITLNVVGDGVFEGDETLSITLTGPNNATLGDGVAVVTIADDDAGAAPPALPVPTLSPWLLMLLALGVAGLGAITVRTRRTH